MPAASKRARCGASAYDGAALEVRPGLYGEGPAASLKAECTSGWLRKMRGATKAAPLAASAAGQGPSCAKELRTAPLPLTQGNCEGAVVSDC